MMKSKTAGKTFDLVLMAFVLLSGRVCAQDAASVPEYRTLFPFYLRDSNCSTAFAVFNQSSSAASLDFSLYGHYGVLVSTKTNPFSTVLGGKAQLARMGPELFGVGSRESESGWVELRSSQPVAGFFQFLSNNQIDGATAFTESHKNLVFTRVIEDSTTSTLLTFANPHEIQAIIVLDLIADPAWGAGMESLVIPPHGEVQVRAGNMFDHTKISRAYVRAEVASGEGVVGFELLRFQEAAVGLKAQPTSSQTRLFSAQYAEGPDVFTNLRLVNTNWTENLSRRVTATAINDQGKTVAGPVTMNLVSLEVREYARVRDLFPAFAGNTLVASLKIEADGPGIVGDVMFGHPKMTYAAALPLQDTPFTRAVFSHVACGMGYFTGLGLYNPGSAAASATIRVYQAGGKLTGTAQLTLLPGCRQARLLHELVPAAKGQVGGYVLVESTQPLVGQQLFGLENFSLLSAVPPVSITGQ